MRDRYRHSNHHQIKESIPAFPDLPNQLGADILQQLHEESLTEGRDILKTENEAEKKKWLTKTGTDWSGAFGENPEKYIDPKAKKQVSFISLHLPTSFGISHCKIYLDKLLAGFRSRLP